MLSTDDLVDCFFSGPMCRECYHKLTICNLTQTASGACYILMDCCGASDNLATVGCCIESVGLFRINNRNGGNVMITHHTVGIIDRLTRCVNCETFRVCIFDHFDVVIIQRVMGISITTAPTVSINQLRNHVRVDVTQNVGKVSANIVAPDLTPLDVTNLGDKFTPNNTTLAGCYLAPM